MPPENWYLSVSSKMNKLLTQLSTYLNVPCGKICFDSFGIPIRTHNNVASKGIFNIIKNYIKESNRVELLGRNEREQAQVYQFIEYGNVYVIGSNVHQTMTEILPHIHGWLIVNTYLCGTKMTVADILMYYLLYDILAEISHLEQVKFLNVFRWLDNLQEDRNVRQKNTLITFNVNLASCGDIPKQTYAYNL